MEGAENTTETVELARLSGATEAEHRRYACRIAIITKMFAEDRITADRKDSLIDRAIAEYVSEVTTRQPAAQPETALPLPSSAQQPPIAAKTPCTGGVQLSWRPG